MERGGGGHQKQAAASESGCLGVCSLAGEGASTTSVAVTGGVWVGRALRDV